MASARPTGPNPNSLLIRGIAGLSVVVALIGVIAVFTKGGGSSSPSGHPATGATTPASTPTSTPSPTPSATPTPSPASSSTPGVTPTPSTVGSAAATPTATTRAAPTTATSGSPTTPTSSSPTTPSGGRGATLTTPAVGSYSYATSGGEQTSFPGTARSYPSNTTIKISNAGCGVNETWTPISQHSETQQLCVVGNQLRLASDTTTISFFGQSVTQKFTCTDALVYDTAIRPGQTWSFTCRGNGAKITEHLKAVRFETVDVASGQVRTLHLLATSKVSGADGGTTTENIWIRTGPHPFMVRTTAVVNAKNGGITYSESYTLQLNHF